jgi:hypothetical protein
MLAELADKAASAIMTLVMSNFAAGSRYWKANLRVSPPGFLLQASVPQFR